MSVHSPPEFPNEVPAGWVTLEELTQRCARLGVLPPRRTVLHLGERLASALAYLDSSPRPDARRSPVRWDASPCQVLLGPGGRIGMSVDSTPGAQPQADDSKDKLASLGALLYEALTGTKPKSLKDGETDAILSPSCHRSDLGDDLELVVMRCLYPQKYEPIPSAEALGDLLTELLRQPTSSPENESRTVDPGTCRVTALFLLELFPEVSSHSTLSVTPTGEAPSWLALAHLTAPPEADPNFTVTPSKTSKELLLGNEWDLAEDPVLGLQNEDTSTFNQSAHHNSARELGQRPIDSFVQRRGEEPDLYVGSSDTPHRLLWATLAILGPLVILAIGQALKN